MLETLPPATRLARRPVFALDCQATGPNPRKDRLLEIGWALTTGKSGRLVESQTHRLRLTPDIALPRAVTRVTGLTTADLKRGLSPRRAWKRLLAATEAIHGPAPSRPPLLIIHFARYETAFLERMHYICRSGRPFPFEIICTHAIARRLYPGLPRLGLRALAGYLALPLPEFRRCRPHLKATAHIWRHLCQRLAAMEIHSLADLKAWLQTSCPALAAPRVYPMPAEKLDNLPDTPGVYRFLDSGGRTLYVGKTKSLSLRIRSYFQPRRRHSEHILEMLTQARDIHLTPAQSALEAALSEFEQIGRLRPVYNIALRKTGRRLALWRRDLRPQPPRDSPGLLLGFFPPTDLLEDLRSLMALIQSPQDRTPEAEMATIARLVGVGPDPAPPPDLVSEGLAWLCTRYPHLRNTHGLVPFLALGARWQWRQTVAAMEPQDPTETSLPEGDAVSADDGDWSAQGVAEALLDGMAQAARLIRRSHWFTLLSESSFAWRSADSSRPGNHLLIFSQGRVRQRAFLKCLDQLPDPPAWNRPHQARLTRLTAEDVLRLRVFTTEIKRLAASRRPLALCLGPHRHFEGPDLARIIAWL